ncbi:MAG: antibiotic biosynthesis monooxygenase [Rhodothermia bacterium]|nr:antibiotic biosynthesis monooxygenase [Rhodothermia bacterium]
MSNVISWNLQMAVRDGRLDDARNLVKEMVAATRQEEPGTQIYEYFLSPDGSSCHIYERYADSDAALVHLGNFGSKYVDRFLACFEPTSLSVYGEPSPDARAALDGFGAAYLGPFEGFSR